LNNGGKLPMFTSCCPAWIKYVEQRTPELIENISSCKSPHEMEGSIIKTYYAKKMGVNPKDIFVVSIMPCTVKKYESARLELSENSLPDVDAVLTTRELVRLFKLAGIDFDELPESQFDSQLGESTGAAAIFGTSGGVMEAALRTAYNEITGEELNELSFESIRGFGGIKEAEVIINGTKINVAVVNGIGNVKEIINDVKNGKSKYHFIEVMTCPGGCINGGGQPIHRKREKILKRKEALYNIDLNKPERKSYENASIKTLYKEFLIEPGSHISHEILHTKYFNKKRSIKIIAD
jgi:iron-only hydrogenase group A